MNRIVIGIADQTMAGDLRSRLEELDLDLELAFVAEGTQEMVAGVLGHHPAILFVHDRLGPGPVARTVRDLTLRQPALAVLMVSSDTTADVYSTAMDAGARGVVAYPFGLEDLSSRIAGGLEWSEHMRAVVADGGLDRAGAAGAGRIVAFAGAKGGVGVTVLATHLAWDVTTKTEDVRSCLVDLDLEKGDVPSYIDVSHRVSIADLAKISDDLTARAVADTVAVHSSGLHLLLAPVEIRDTEFVGPDAVRHVLAQLRSLYDVVLVDTGAAVTPVQAAAVEMADEVVQLVTPDVPALRSARRQSLAWESLGVKDPAQVHVVVNRFAKHAEIRQDTVDQLVLGHRSEVLVPDLGARMERAINSRTPSEVTDRVWWSSLRAIGGEVDVLASHRQRRAAVAAAAKQPIPEGEASAAATGATAEGTGQQRRAAGRRRALFGRQREQGQVALETVALVPLAIILLVIAWQVVLLGLSFVWAGRAANAASRAVSVGAEPLTAARRVVPGSVRDDLSVSTSGNAVTVRVKASLLTTGAQSRTVTVDVDRQVVKEPR